ncbi:MAG: DUF2815 family protein [Clostridia bacterium]|nr:DUF2815 family protein [Clostridia bacterium]MBQ8129658.1 DUF2815 family protein [Clostridia bacterium]
MFEPGEYAAEQAYQEFLSEQRRARRMATKCVTDKVRFSYVNIFKSRSFREGQEAKYSICLLIPKDDKKTVSKIQKAIDEAVQEGIASKWGGKKPKNLRLPLRDGDEERADEAAEYEGMYFMNANSNTKPGIVDKDLNEILDPDEVYSGCWGRASVNFFAYDSNGNRGIGCGLNNIQKLKDGERLGAARASAEDDFSDDYVDDEEDF